ncbi:MAG: DNA-binding protein WhiA [Eubacteriaceae bacterium]|nr:DNA-binding protein WhiA [Eubacteriaceae bacterium]
MLYNVCRAKSIKVYKMRFHEEIKNYLALREENSIEEMEASLYGICASGASVSISAGTGAVLRLSAQTAAIARYIFKLIHKAFVLKATVYKTESSAFGTKAGRYMIEVADKLRTMEMLAYFGISAGTPHPIQQSFLADEACRQAFLRGVFIACGYATDPKSAYLIEFRLENKALANGIKGFLAEYGLIYRIREKNKQYVVYAKQADAYSTTLALIGANQYCLAAEGSYAMKDMKNQLTRAVNCDTANLNRTVEASLAQLEAIKRIEGSGNFDSLPQPLKDAAELRRANELASLSELSEDSKGRVSKSALSRRLNKLIELSKKY